jgi:hypothetical protein
VKPLKLDWTKHLHDPQRKEDFEKTLRNSTLILDRLRTIMTEWEQSILAEETSKDQYTSGSWAMLQAHRNGNREIIKKVKDLTDIY